MEHYNIYFIRTYLFKKCTDLNINSNLRSFFSFIFSKPDKICNGVGHCKCGVCSCTTESQTYGRFCECDDVSCIRYCCCWCCWCCVCVCVSVFVCVWLHLFKFERKNTILITVLLFSVKMMTFFMCQSILKMKMCLFENLVFYAQATQLLSVVINLCVCHFTMMEISKKKRERWKREKECVFVCV